MLQARGRFWVAQTQNFWKSGRTWGKLGRGGGTFTDSPVAQEHSCCFSFCSKKEADPLLGASSFEPESQKAAASPGGIRQPHGPHSTKEPP